MDSAKTAIAVVGASNDRNKFGNKAVRAFLKKGYSVFPVNPKETTVENLTCYKTLEEIPEKLDEVTFYVPAPVVPGLLAAAAAKGAKRIWLNPGTESDDAVKKAESLGLHPIVSCSIVAIGENPHDL